MPTFDTPGPISVRIELRAGDVHIAATDRIDTVVEVRPMNDNDRADLEAAEQTRIEHAGDQLSVVGPKPRLLGWATKARPVDVLIALPAGSRVQASIGVGDVRVTGRLGDCRITTGVGLVLLDDTGALSVTTGAGDVLARCVSGSADVVTGSGAVRLGTVEDNASVKNGNGRCDIGSVHGDLRVRGGNGGIVVESAGGNVEAKTANGSFRVGGIVRGEVHLDTAMGDVEVGVGPDTRAWLDVKDRLRTGHQRPRPHRATGCGGGIGPDQRSHLFR